MSQKTVVEKSQLLNYALQNKNAVALQVYERWKKWDEDTQQAKVFGYSLVFFLVTDFFVSKSQSVSVYISSYYDHLGSWDSFWAIVIFCAFIMSFIAFQTGRCESEYEIEASKILKSDGFINNV